MQHFGRHVEGRPDLAERLDGVCVEHAPEAQVPELEDVVGGDEDVGGLDVAMHHTLLVHVRDRPRHLQEVAPHLALLEGSSSFAEQPPQVSVLRPLEHNHEFVVLDKRIEVGDQVVMLADRLQHVNFSQAFVAAFRIHHVEDMDLLQRHIPPIHISCSEHNRELPASNLLPHFIVLQTTHIHRQDILQSVNVYVRLRQLRWCVFASPGRSPPLFVVWWGSDCWARSLGLQCRGRGRGAVMASILSRRLLVAHAESWSSQETDSGVLGLMF
mmetsp:Transcript_37465/g.88172  ORF Transcript_37465/g.88172 Transcript_37465/m.88172 type:complete len:270 (+) Transcript_37465:876-1685(+)